MSIGFLYHNCFVKLSKMDRLWDNERMDLSELKEAVDTDKLTIAIADEARRVTVPVRTGFLRSTIYADVRQKRVVAEAFYAWWVELRRRYLERAIDAVFARWRWP